MNPTFAGLPINPHRPQVRLSRTAVITVAVVALHGGMLWGLQSGLLVRTAELIVPVELLAQFIAPPEPVPAQSAPAPPAPPAPQTRPVAVVLKKNMPRPFAQAAAIPTVLGYNTLVRGNKSVSNKLGRFAHDLHAYFVTGARVVSGPASANGVAMRNGA